MAEQFTANAIRAQRYALAEALRQGHKTIAPEHLLLGLIRVDSGVAEYVLDDEGVTLMKCRAATAAMAKSNNEEIPLKRPWYKPFLSRCNSKGLELTFTAEAKTALSLASIFAKKCKRDLIDTQDLLVGILDAPSSKVGEILRRSGAEPDKIRQRLMPSTSPIVITWDLFPARKQIAVGALALVLLGLIVVGDFTNCFRLCFASFVMRLLEDYVSIFEERSSVKTGIFESKLKYFIFLNGGIAAIWLLTVIILPQGMVGIPAIMFWITVFLLSLLTSKASSRAATRRAFKVVPVSGNNTSDNKLNLE